MTTETDDEPLTLMSEGGLIESSRTHWFICFVPPIRRQRWHILFHRKHKHCFAMRPTRDGKHWTLFEPWWTRLMVQTIDHDKAIRFLRWAKRGDVLQVPDHVPGNSSQIRVWMTCAALCAHLLGRSYQVWTPHQLYRRLRAETTSVEWLPGDVDGLIKRLRQSQGQ